MSLLQMSFYGGVMILCITLVRALFIERLPKRTFLALWGAAAARLVVPFALPSALSVYTLLARAGLSSGAAAEIDAAPAVQNTAAIAQNTALTLRAAGQSVAAAANAAPSVQNTAVAAAEASASPLPVWPFVWAGVALCLAAGFAAVYWRNLREFRTSLPVRSDFAARWLQAHPLKRTLAIRQSDRVSTPLTYGILRPVILVPARTNWADTETLQYVLAHEYTHVRRFDSLAKLFLTAVLCLHWFNPLVWVMYILTNRDIELACDEAVVRSFGLSSRAGYAQALIRMEERRCHFVPLCSGFSKNAIEERIVSIMKTRKSSFYTRLAACVLVAGLAVACGTTPASSASAGGLSASAAAAEPVSSSTTQMSRADYQYLSSGSVKKLVSPNGTISYQITDGKLTETISEEEFCQRYPDLDIEWWTASDYSAWLAKKKTELQGRLGQTNAATGKVWTQAQIDAAISGYEEMLEDIENGMLLSKSKYGGVLCSVDFHCASDSSDKYYLHCTISATGESFDFEYNSASAYLAAVQPFFSDQVRLGNVTWPEAYNYTAYAQQQVTYEQAHRDTHHSDSHHA